MLHENEKNAPSSGGPSGLPHESVRAWIRAVLTAQAGTRPELRHQDHEHRSPYVPLHAASDFLKSTTSRSMRVANEIL
jgi:hypothetical protein